MLVKNKPHENPAQNTVKNYLPKKDCIEMLDGNTSFEKLGYSENGSSKSTH